MQVAASAPHTTGWSPTVGPDVTELLTVVALRKAVQRKVGFHTNCYMAEVGELEHFLRSLVSRKRNEKERKVCSYSFSARTRTSCGHLCDTNYVEGEVSQTIRDVFGWCFRTQVPDNGLDMFLRFGVKSEIT